MILNSQNTFSRSVALPQWPHLPEQSSAIAENKQHSEKDNVEQVAIQFESLFIHEMLKTMRSSIPQSEWLNSDALQQYTEMYDQQLSTHLAQQGLGLRALIMQQLGANVTEKHAEFPNKQAFINEVGQVVEQAVQRQASTYDTKALLAIAALETGWGQHVIENANGQSSNNLFNIKANAHWQGETVSAQTTEYINHHAITLQDEFRQYANLTESVNDFMALMQQSRYAKATAVANEGEAFLQAIADAGYATDPQYANKLTRIYKTL